MATDTSGGTESLDCSVVTGRLEMLDQGQPGCKGLSFSVLVLCSSFALTTFLSAEQSMRRVRPHHESPNGSLSQLPDLMACEGTANPRTLSMSASWVLPSPISFILTDKKTKDGLFFRTLPRVLHPQQTCVTLVRGQLEAHHILTSVLQMPFGHCGVNQNTAQVAPEAKPPT